ncbi:uncharacterized, partial [Tachysurus ichikawai]
FGLDEASESPTVRKTAVLKARDVKKQAIVKFLQRMRNVEERALRHTLNH